MKVPLSSIVTDRKYQVRITGIDTDTVRQYAEAMTDGAQFPPIVVFKIDAAYILVDGWHRYRAAVSLGWAEIEAEVREGTEEDAYNYSRFQANRTNGQRLSRADLQALCEAVVSDPVLNTRSDRELGKLIGVDHKTIGRTRVRVGIVPAFKVSSNGKTWVTGLYPDSTLEVRTDPPPNAPECPEGYGQESLVAALAARLEENLCALDVSLRRVNEYSDLLSDNQRRHILRVTTAITQELGDVKV